MDIWECALGFMDSQVLLTAEALGVFDQLAAGRDTAEGIAGAVGLSEDATRRLMTALCALELVEKQPEGRYRNSPEADEKLVRGRPGYIGSMFRHVRDDLYPLWGHFREALEEEEAQWERAFGNGTAGNDQLYEDPQALRAFMEGMHVISYKAAQDFAAQAPELAEVEHLVDVGGASGAFAIALAKAYPSLRATVFDLPPVQPITEDYFAKYEMNGRLSFEGGDFWSDPLPDHADAYALGFILHDWDTGGGSFLLDKIARTLQSGGLLIVGEYLLNEDRTGPLHVARQDLNMLVAARGRERTAAEYSDWFAAFGFDVERIVPTWHGKHFLVARRRG